MKDFMEPALTCKKPRNPFFLGTTKRDRLMTLSGKKNGPETQR
jgi:hypothetical protein